MLNIDDFNLDGQRVFIRSDLNVPIDDSGKVLDAHRIHQALPTIRYALERGAKVIVASHLARPDGVDLKYSLMPVADKLSELLDVDVFFAEEVLSCAPEAIARSLKQNQLIVLENLRFHSGEMENDSELAKSIAQYVDIYINDAFGVCHREHMSLSALPKYVEKKGIGFLIKKEIEYLDKIKKEPAHPFALVLGGGKVPDKLALVESMVDKVDKVIVGGAMAYVFLKAQGVKLGDTKVYPGAVGMARDLMDRLEAKGKTLYLPVDHVVVPKIQKTAQAFNTLGESVPTSHIAVDIGPQTRAIYKDALSKVKTVFWNGPMGIFEIPEYARGTKSMIDSIAALPTDVFSVIGGGDSARAVFEYKMADHFSHVSTGGGASLAYIQDRTLAGFKNLN